jgi:hypothetical protein
MMETTPAGKAFVGASTGPPRHKGFASEEERVLGVWLHVQPISGRDRDRDRDKHYNEFRMEHNYDEREMDHAYREYSIKELKEPMVEEVIKSIPSLAIKLQESIPSLAIKLQDKNALLFGSYDRDKSESEFRLSIAPPLAVLAVQFILLGLDRSLLMWPWAGYAALIAVVALIVMGFQKRFSSVNVVVTALEIGTIESQMITRLDAIPADEAPDKVAAETA